MPIYEYRCAPCDHDFETLVRSAADVPRCPRCGGIDLARLPSVPAAAQAGGRGSDLPLCAPTPTGCGGGMCRSGMCGMEE